MPGFGKTIASLLAVAPVAALAQTPYAAPSGVAEMDGWKSVEHWRSPDHADPQAPRYISVALDPSDARDWNGLKKWITEVQGLNPAAPLQLEPLEVWKQVDGSDRRMTIAGTTRGGKPHVAFLMAKREDGSPYTFRLVGLEVPRSTYEKWGGVAFPLMMREIIPSVDAFPAKERAAVARASYPRQVAVFEAALNRHTEVLAAGLVAQMGQAQTLLRMQELNYDLLLGGDTTSPTIAD
ncbi:hypothetical protein [Altericroceibacterium xinjiangense]|uniref:hypothetical protein n=1 Tax=Altericroceibacterium xinjiangense TaxID=762261 RepID=UPI000F7ED762|nr:hypothetical protein [Altericroceibacterium xinjiangense]